MTGRAAKTGTKKGGKAGAARDVAIARALEAWFAASARDLPWRRSTEEAAAIDAAKQLSATRNPFGALVAELMLQQTQASRVAELFPRFMARFPTAAALAAASEQDVLAMWAGLGYYRRARLLHAAAREIVERHAGRVPSEAAVLRELPGVGRYTAGAIASIVFGAREAMVDGNVVRVMARLEADDGGGQRAGREAMAWERAGALVRVAERPGVMNEALMELGATVCTPRGPKCGVCPVSSWCAARKAGVQEAIPSAGARAAVREVYHAVVVVRDARGRTLVEQRGASGLWARMWQAPTVERDDEPAQEHEVRESVGAARAERTGSFTHKTTHRLVQFEVWRGVMKARAQPRRGVWVSEAELKALPLASPQKRVLVGEG